MIRHAANPAVRGYHRAMTAAVADRIVTDGAERARLRAIVSDALESIVNVVAAVFALGGIVFAGRPADRNHPYGHGKIEFFSAAFEGGLIAFAAVVIVYEVARSLLTGPEVHRLGTGGLVVLAAGLVNLVLGWYLVRTGRRYQ